jgi:hypothetical protein
MAKARKDNKLDYDAPLEGLQVLDRYTLRIKLKDPFYNFIYNLADCRVSCAVAREVIEHYGEDSTSHPVGTGPTASSRGSAPRGSLSRRTRTTARNTSPTRRRRTTRRARKWSAR